MEREKLEEANRWWVSGKVSDELAPEYKRKIFDELTRQLQKRFIIALVGLRRVGKTTLLYQLIRHMLASGIKAENILFFSFDEKREELNDVLETYKQIQSKDFGKEKIYVFFDEIQKAKGWENQLKKYYDLYPKLKFFISGSESLFIVGKTKETLAGRLFEYFLPPLSFIEYLELSGVGEKEMRYETKVKPLFLNYVERGGFPEMIASDLSDVKRYVKSIVVDKIVYQDIPTLAKIRDSELLVNLLEVISANPGMHLDYQSLAQQLDRDRRVIRDYIFWLKESFLVRTMANYRKGRLVLFRKIKKVYPTDCAVIQAFKPVVDTAFFGRMVETAIVNSVDAEVFWKNRHEVDAVVDGMPIEVKYQPKIVSSDLKGVREFMRKFSSKKGIVVTKDEEKEVRLPEGRITLIPAWKFLLRQSLLRPSR